MARGGGGGNIKEYWGVAALALLGAVIVLARIANFGVALPWDATNYIGVAHNLAAGEGWVEQYGRPLTIWPPLLPTVLALPILLGVDPVRASGLLNAAAFGLTILATGCYLMRRLRSRLVALWAAAALCASVPMAWLASSAMTGALFTLLVAMALICADGALGAKAGRRWLVMAGLFSALAWLSRYVGVVLVATIAATLALQQGLSMPQRLRRLTTFTVVACAPMGLWLLRNHAAVGSFITSPRPAWFDQSAMLEEWRILASWAAPHSAPEPWQPVLDFAPILTGTALALIAVAAAFVKIAAWRSAVGMERSAPIHGAFALAYLGVLAASLEIGYAWSGMHPRYMVPIYMPLVTVVAFAADRLLQHAWRPQRAVKLSLAVALSSWLVLQGALQWQETVRAHRQETARGNYGYGRDYATSPALAWLRAADVDRVHTNAPNLLNALRRSKAQAYFDMPKCGTKRAPQRCDLSSWQSCAADGDHVIWFHGWASELFGYDAADLSALPRLEQLVGLQDAAVFRVVGEATSRAAAMPRCPPAPILLGAAGEA